ncbi:MAG: stage II sporulation protein P [Oscillospiraceae bacterium]
MKKIARFFALPMLLMIILFLYGNNLIFTGANAAGILFARPQKEPPQSDSAVPPTQEDNAFAAPESATGFDSPFKDFALPKNTPLYDTDYPIAEMTYAPALNSITYQRQNCYVKNMTKLSKGEVETQLLAPLDFEVEKDSPLPQILIMHTHATESYQNHPEPFYDPEYTCRSLDTSLNMVSVGAIIAKQLNLLGYNTLHDDTLHDHPSYNASYGRSKATVQDYLEKYPSIKIVLDIHRDAIERKDGTRIKPVITLQNKKYAQVMIICGADNGYLNMPNYKKNLRFASHLQNSMETLYPGFTRPLLFDYRNYNQQLSTGSLLIEVGSHANTLEEAQNSAKLIAYSLAKMFERV